CWFLPAPHTIFSIATISHLDEDPHSATRVSCLRGVGHAAGGHIWFHDFLYASTCCALTASSAPSGQHMFFGTAVQSESAVQAKMSAGFGGGPFGTEALGAGAAASPSGDGASCARVSVGAVRPPGGGGASSMPHLPWVQIDIGTNPVIVSGCSG